MNTSNGLMSGFYTISTWIMRFAYLNLLGILFTFLGLILLGFFPALTAMCTVIRKWLMKETETPIFQEFFHCYKKDFWKSNTLGAIILLVGTVIYTDYLFVNTNGTSLLVLFQLPLAIFILLFFLTSLYIFPTFVHYHLTIVQVVKTSFFIMFTSPLHTVLMIVGCFLFYFLLLKIPGLFIVFGLSGFCFLIMFPAHAAFSRIQKKHG